MQFYSFDEIKARGDCRRFVTEVLGCDINREGRCIAVWRGGDDYNVKVDKDEWFDHRDKVGGGLIELCAIAKFNNKDETQLAQNFLGEWLRLEPKIKLKPNPLANRGTLYERLVDDGYSEVKRYLYEDSEGNVVHHVARMEHPTKHKEFVQGTPEHWGLGDVKPILYRMKDWVSNSKVCIVEGEKDVDTLIDRLGIPATTNCGGADKWRPEYAQLFKGKNVAIIRDNDEAGEKHAQRVASELKDVAAEIRIICPSKLPKGDATDWVEQEGGTKDALLTMLRESAPLNPEEIDDIEYASLEAKKANNHDITNFWIEKKQIGNETKNVRVPKKTHDIVKDIHTRFLGFPRKVGDSRAMFDHDRDSGEIVSIDTTAALFAWMSRKSKHVVQWPRGDGFLEKSELYAALHAEAQRYEAISYIPDWPKRAEVYYAHEKLPAPSPEHEHFNRFVNFFNPASDEDRTLLKAFICAPLWYEQGLPRPSWVFDSPDGAGAGKTTAAELIAKLYLGTPLKMNLRELKTRVEDITKRVVSTSGRQLRIALIDNVVGDVACSELADFITAESISGKAPYGRGEESRPNNLTYVITSNSAQLDNDLIDRSFFINFGKPRRTPTWKREVLDYIKTKRLHIIADMIDMLSHGEKLDEDPKTRFPEFESIVLRAVCTDKTEYLAAVGKLSESRTTSNSDEEQAEMIEAAIREQLTSIKGVDLQRNIYISKAVFNLWLKWSCERDLMKSVSVQQVETQCRNRLMQHLRDKPKRLKTTNDKRFRGMLWAGNPDSDVVECLIDRGTDDKPYARPIMAQLSEKPALWSSLRD